MLFIIFLKNTLCNKITIKHYRQPLSAFHSTLSFWIQKGSCFWNLNQNNFNLDCTGLFLNQLWIRSESVQSSCSFNQQTRPLDLNDFCRTVRYSFSNFFFAHLGWGPSSPLQLLEAGLLKGGFIFL